MTKRIAINGFGRIGRCILRALYEQGYREQLQVVAINELADIDSVSYMLRYDSTHGRFNGEVEVKGEYLVVEGDAIRVFHQEEIHHLDWNSLDIDIVFECTGQIRTRSEAEKHLQAGAKKVLISNPADLSVDKTIIYGHNQDELSEADKIVSNASCSTNALFPVLSTLDEKFGIVSGLTTTIHSAMNDQPVIDAYHSDLRRTRAAMQSIIPVDTGLPKGLQRLMPHLEGKIESLHLRVPTYNVSALDVSLQLSKSTSVQEVNDLLQSAADEKFDAVLGVTSESHASIDFNHDHRSAIVDATQTRVSGGQLVKLLIWFDNEWGFANRMLDTACCMR